MLDGEAQTFAQSLESDKGGQRRMEGKNFEVHTCPAEFDKWLRLLPWKPWLIPCVKHGKEPDVPKGESWKATKWRLSLTDARKRIQAGLNVGVVATGRDFVFFDHDDPEKFTLPIKTLTVQTRNGKLHKYYVNGGDVKNADGKGRYKGCGEVRAEWKYVLVPGSYVPPDENAGAGATGLYRVLVAKPPAKLYAKDLPREFQPSFTPEPTEDKPRPMMAGSFRNQYGWSIEDLRRRDKKLDELLSILQPAGYPSPSEADMACLSKLLFWGYTESEAVDILRHFRGRKKLNREDYVKATLSKVAHGETIGNYVDVFRWNPVSGYELPFETEQPIFSGKHKVSLVFRVVSKREVKVRAINGGKPVTAWITVDRPEKLRTSRNAKVIRELLEKEQPEDWRLLLEEAIQRIQAAVAKFKPETPSLRLQSSLLRGEVSGDPVVLSHLNMIENPDLAGEPVIVEAVVSSTSIAYLAPSELEATFEDREGNPVKVTENIEPHDPVNLQLIGTHENIKYRRLKRLLGTTRDVNIKETSWRTVYRVRVRPPVFTLEKRGEKIVDERGFEYKAYDIYITSDRPVAFQPSSLLKVEGKPVPNPKTQQTTLLAYRAEFPEEVTCFDSEKLSTLLAKFQGMNVRQRLNWVLNNFECYSHIVGRRNLAEAGLLCYFTPTWIRFNGEIQRGWGVMLICGDTTTAKTETVRKLISLLKAGMLITAETASTVGLTGTATQVEREGWFVDWGFLVLLDRKLLAVDGAHKLSLSNWAALAEAERSGVVSIAKAAKNTAYARTRQLKIANAVDPEAGKYSTKSLAGFLYACQALTTILDKTSIARLDLAVFADQGDVKAEEINRLSDQRYEPELELLSEALKWCWSDNAEVRFTDEAVNAIHNAATKLYNTFFCESIPLVSIDMKWKLARLSAALAYLTLSTNDFNTVTVTREHVETVVEFVREEYSRSGLNTLAEQTKHEKLTAEDVSAMLTRIRNAMAKSAGDFEEERLREILRYIVYRGRVTKDELKAKFSLAENNEARPLLASLKSEGLIKVSRGFYPEPKLIQAFKVTGGLVF